MCGFRFAKSEVKRGTIAGINHFPPHIFGAIGTLIRRHLSKIELGVTAVSLRSAEAAERKLTSLPVPLQYSHLLQHHVMVDSHILTTFIDHYLRPVMHEGGGWHGQQPL